MRKHFFNSVLALILASFGFAGVSCFSVFAWAEDEKKPDEQVYQLKDNPEAELDRVQKEAAPLNLDQEESVEESGQAVTNEAHIDMPNPEYRHYFQKGIEVQAGYSFFAPDSYSSGSNSDTSVTLSSSGSPTIGARYTAIRNDGFGFTAGFHMEPSYSLSGIKANGNLDSTTIATSGKIFMFTPEVNVTYEMEGAYLFAGGNYSLPSGSVGKTSIQGGFGGQVGVGWFIGNTLSNLDFGSNSLTVEILAQSNQIQFSNLGGRTYLPSGSYVDVPVTQSQPITMVGGLVRVGLNFR